MEKDLFSWNRFYSMPLIGIMRGIPPDDIARILPVYHDAGLTSVEITMNSPGCEESIRNAVAAYGGKINVGAGTVCTEEDLEKALQAGARFIVTPIVNFKVIERCKRSGTPIFAGAFTPTEMFNAWAAGADMVKVFPATMDGINYLKAVRGPLPQIKLLPTGGVDLDNCAAFMHAGASGLGIGSQLFHKNHIQNKDWSALSAHFALFTQKLRPFSRQSAAR